MPKLLNFMPIPTQLAFGTQGELKRCAKKRSGYVRCVGGSRQALHDAQAGESPFATAIEGLTILRLDHLKPPSHVIFKSALCIVVQGAKWSIFGGKRFDYRAGEALVVSIEMSLYRFPGHVATLRSAATTRILVG